MTESVSVDFFTVVSPSSWVRIRPRLPPISLRVGLSPYRSGTPQRLASASQYEVGTRRHQLHPLPAHLVFDWEMRLFKSLFGLTVCCDSSFPFLQLPALLIFPPARMWWWCISVSSLFCSIFLRILSPPGFTALTPMAVKCLVPPILCKVELEALPPHSFFSLPSSPKISFIFFFFSRCRPLRHPQFSLLPPHFSTCCSCRLPPSPHVPPQSPRRPVGVLPEPTFVSTTVLLISPPFPWPKCSRTPLPLISVLSACSLRPGRLQRDVWAPSLS